MRKISILICLLFSGHFVKAQCDLSVIDTTHINCNGDALGGFVLDVGGAVSPYTILLSNGIAQVDNPVFTSLPAATYEVIIVDNDFCMDTLDLKIKEPSLLLLSLKCEEDRLAASVLGGVREYSYTWRDEDETVVSIDSSVVYESGLFYAVEVVDANTCIRVDTVHVWAEFDVNRRVGEIPFDVYIDNHSSSGLYEWDFGGVGSSYSFEPSYTFDEVGGYEIVLNVEDESTSCLAVFSTFVDAQGFEMKGENDWAEMYDVITPNGDGNNDNFSFLENHAILSFEAVIYNRWGVKIYEWTDPKAVWNGVTKGGVSVSEGVYFYTMNAVGKNGDLYEKKGAINVFH